MIIILHELNTESIVFLEEDTGLENPILRHLYSFSGVFRPQDTFKDLRRMLQSILDVQNLNCVSHEVENFLRMLTDNSLKPKTLLSHPIMWKPRQRLGYIIGTRNLIRRSSLKFQNDVLGRFKKDVACDWIEMVKQYAQLKRRLEFAQFKYGKAYYNNLYGLISFVRDSSRSSTMKMEFHLKD